METLIVIIVALAAILFILMLCNDIVCDYSICDVLSHYCGLHKDDSIIENSETKDVDLEKEIDEVIHNYKLNNHRHTSICSADIEWIAKHFFELAKKGE